MSDLLQKSARSGLAEAPERGSTPDAGVSDINRALRQAVTALDTAPLIEAIKGAGYQEAGSQPFHNKQIQKFFNPADDTLILLADANALPGREASQGGACIVTHQNRLVLGILIPTPSERTFLERFENVLDSPQGMKEFRSELTFRGAHAQFEALNHEFVHLEQIKTGTPWGRVLLTEQAWQIQQSLREQGFEVPVTKHLRDFLLPDRPTKEEIGAAVIVSEIIPHMVNETTAPERAKNAGKVAVFINHQLNEAPEANRHSEISRVLTMWQRFLSQYECYNVGGGKAAVDIAAGWLIKQGALS